MATRADNNEGSCKEILVGKHAGKWLVQYLHEDEFGRKRRLSRLFPNKTEGKAFLRGLRKGAKVEAARQRKELTLGGWFDWLAEHDWPESLDAKTIALRKSRFDRYVRDELGHRALAKIDPLAVRRFYRCLLDRGTGQATVHAVKANMVRVFNQAVTPYGWLPVSMANPFRLVLKAAPPRDAVAITPERAAKALACPDLDPSERALLGLYLLAGVRLSEQMALTRGQLLFDQGLIAVDRAVKLYEKGMQTLGLPKGSKRRLAVMCPALQALKARCRRPRPGRLSVTVPFREQAEDEEAHLRRVAEDREEGGPPSRHVAPRLPPLSYQLDREALARGLADDAQGAYRARFRPG